MTVQTLEGQGKVLEKKWEETEKVGAGSEQLKVPLPRLSRCNKVRVFQS